MHLQSAFASSSTALRAVAGAAATAHAVKAQASRSLERRPPTQLERDSKGKRVVVLITGATGFLGSRVVERLLALGHTVHAVVAPHEFQNPALTAHLRALPHKDGQLLLFQGDVTQPGSCDAALQAGATRLLHLAAMVKIATNKKEQDMMMHVAMEGTRNVLESASRSKTIQRVVISSSIAAVAADNWERGRDHTFTESDWAIDCWKGHNTYNYAKRESEKLANELAAGQSRWELASLNPGVTWGPITHAPHALTSPGMLSGALRGELPGSLYTAFADVDDVAAAACSALLSKKSVQGRHIVVSQTTSLRDAIAVVKRDLPDIRVVGRGPELPDGVMRLLPKLVQPLTGHDLGVLSSSCGKPVKVDSSKALATFGMEGGWIPLEQTIVDTAASLQRLGLLASYRQQRQ